MAILMWAGLLVTVVFFALGVVFALRAWGLARRQGDAARQLVKLQIGALVVCLGIGAALSGVYHAEGMYLLRIALGAPAHTWFGSTAMRRVSIVSPDGAAQDLAPEPGDIELFARGARVAVRGNDLVLTVPELDLLKRSPDSASVTFRAVAASVDRMTQPYGNGTGRNGRPLGGVPESALASESKAILAELSNAQPYAHAVGGEFVLSGGAKLWGEGAYLSLMAQGAEASGRKLQVRSQFMMRATQ